MASPTPARPSATTLRELAAINDEIIALVRAGVPLEAGLSTLGRDLGGRLGQLAERLAERMQRGESLSAALAAEGDRVPVLYRAIVEAGLRSGKLGGALEGIGRTARRMAELRRFTGYAVLYPIFLVLLAWGLFCFFALKMSPGMAALPESLGPALRLTLAVRSVLWLLGPLVPLVLLVGLAIWWRGSRRAAVLDGSNVWGWLPNRRKINTCGRSAALADVLALLIETGVPLPEAVQLAGEASGDAQFASSAAQLAATLAAGNPLSACGDALAPWPSLVRFALVTSRRPEQLAAGLRRAADSYQREAQRGADYAQLVLPLALTVGIGGAVTLAYLYIVYTPYLDTINNFSGW